MDKAFDWVNKNGGITSEADYPYTSGMRHETNMLVFVSR